MGKHKDESIKQYNPHLVKKLKFIQWPRINKIIKPGEGRGPQLEASPWDMSWLSVSR